MHTHTTQWRLSSKSERSCFVDKSPKHTNSNITGFAKDMEPLAGQTNNTVNITGNN